MTKAEKYTAIATNNVAIAENVPKVYAAGQKSMVDESKIVPKTASGSYISVDDVSEIPHSVACKVASANLWRGNNEYSVVGNGTVQTIYQDFSLKGQSCPMSFSCEVASENLEYTENGNLVYLHVMYEDGTANILTLCSNNITSGKVERPINADRAKVIREINIFAHTRFTGGTVTLSNIMINEGTVALPYTPYVDNLESVKVTRTGKNLLDILNGKLMYKTVAVEERTERTLVLSGNGIYKSTCYVLPSFLAGKYITISGNWTSTEGAKGALRVFWLNDKNAIVGKEIARILSSGWKNTGLVPDAPEGAVNLGILVYGNLDGQVTGDYTTTYQDIQVEIGVTGTEFEVFKNFEDYTPNADGSVDGMTSASPYMNIFTDNAGVTLEATYRMSWGMQTERERFYNDFQQGKINVSISFEWLALDKANTTSVVNALSATTTGQTLTLKLSAVNTAFETSSGAADGSTSTEFAALVATKSNWTIVLK